MKDLIERYENKIVCDNPKCDYEILYVGNDSKLLLAFVNMPCPKCGKTLLTPDDYLLSERLINRINWINKWFGWLGIFSRETKKRLHIQVHNEIIIERHEV